MIFTKEACEGQIILDLKPIEFRFIECNKFPVALMGVKLHLMDTRLLLAEAHKITRNCNERYEFFIDVYETKKIDNCIECAPWLLDEYMERIIGYDPSRAVYIKLDEFDMANIYERLNELCLEAFGVTCEKMIRR